MLSFIRGLALAGVLFYVALIYHSTSIALLGILFSLLWLAAFVSLCFQRSRMGFSLVVPIAIAEPGRPAEVQVRVKNRGRMACMKMKFRLDAGNRMERRTCRKWLSAGNAFPGKNCYAFSLSLPGAGSYRIRLGKVRIYDMTGLFYLEWKSAYASSVSVLPEIASVPVRLTGAVRNFYGDADVYDEQRSGNDSSETFVIRPFRDGDKIQSIHWKLSAKTDEWMVRERSLPKACPVVLFLEYRKKKQSRDPALLWQIAAGISFSLMDQGCPHYACWFSSSRKGIVRLRVDDEESFYLFLTWCMEDLAPLPGGSLKALYQENHPGERWVYDLRLIDRPPAVLIKNGEPAAAFHSNRWKQELEETELIL